MPVNFGLLAAQLVGMVVVFAAALFLPAGTLAWPAGWAFLGLFFGFVGALTAWLLRRNPGLLVERMTGIGKADQKGWDKAFFGVARVLFLAWLVVMPLDSRRFRWSHVPLEVQVTGALLLLLAFGVLFLTYRENSFLSPAVRLQTDRGQTVVCTGPYRYVRHPMYAAMIPFFVGTTLLLGSWYGLVPALLLFGTVVVRASREEQTLRAELPGYSAYLAQVRHRFVPHVW